MSHLDEGTIHAWLDGALSSEDAAAAEAHVAGCAACAAKVAEARGMIAGASRILSALDIGPRIEGEDAVERDAAAGALARAAGGVPVDAERRERHERRARGTRRYGAPGLAAAAAVVLALGTAVLVREQHSVAARAVASAPVPATVPAETSSATSGARVASAPPSASRVDTTAIPSLRAAAPGGAKATGSTAPNEERVVSTLNSAVAISSPEAKRVADAARPSGKREAIPTAGGIAEGRNAEPRAFTRVDTARATSADVAQGTTLAAPAAPMRTLPERQTMTAQRAARMSAAAGGSAGAATAKRPSLPNEPAERVAPPSALAMVVAGGAMRDVLYGCWRVEGASPATGTPLPALSALPAVLLIGRDTTVRTGSTIDRLAPQGRWVPLETGGVRVSGGDGAATPRWTLDIARPATIDVRETIAVLRAGTEPPRDVRLARAACEVSRP